ncbi:MAG: alcohol dehydrogenase [Rhodospirillales bacterium]|nr:alcohol dehydrogenase [Rhodospirillales bacterium]MCW8971250.1 alcohol dehydrogenase [Rhodospirillales bacterium]
MTTMRSFKITAFGQPLEEVHHEAPEPTGRQVLLKVGSCGVCHSDVHLWEGHFDLGGGQKLDLAHSLKLPHTLGHEVAGTVVAVGPDVVGAKAGDRRVVYPWAGCGECPTCAAGNEHLCGRPLALGTAIDGGFSDHVLIRDEKYLIDFTGIPEALACTYACSGLTAYSALKKAGAVGEGSPLVIIGAGGVGLAAIRLAKTVCGVSPIVAEIDKGKWDTAQKAGAQDVIDPSDTSSRKAFMKATGGAATVIDFVGAQPSAEFGMGILRKGGELIVVGLFGGAINLSLPMLPLKAISLRGSYVGSLHEMKELVALAQAGNQSDIPVSVRPLGEAQDALDALRKGNVIGRSVLQP